MAADLYHDLSVSLAELRNVGSAAALAQHPLYRRIEARVAEVLSAHVCANRVERAPAHAEHYRVCAWNIERGLRLERTIELLQADPVLSGCDLLLLTELDIGMVRSGNRDVPRLLADALGLNWVFAPSFIELDKGSGDDRQLAGENRYGLHGSAVLSRFPLDDVQVVPLPNPRDRLATREPRLGNEKAVITTARTPAGPLRLAAFHLDVHCSRAHRRRQMETVLDALDGCPHPILVGGDWNTTSVDYQSPFALVVDGWWRLFIGSARANRYHAQPERWAERRLFSMLRRHGLEIEEWNATGVATQHNPLRDPRFRRNLTDWLPPWSLRLVDWVARGDDTLPFKLDWLAGRGLRPRAARVVPVRDDPVSDHDPIVADFTF